MERYGTSWNCFLKNFNVKNRIHIVLICLIISCSKKAPIIDSIEKIEFVPYPNNIESFESALEINSILSITSKSALEVTNIIKKEWEELVKNEISIIDNDTNNGDLRIEIDRKFKFCLHETSCSLNLPFLSITEFAWAIVNFVSSIAERYSIFS